jgi:hypothetical protein
VAHRADFVRAFVLMRFGGLWIDADCIVMRELSPLLRRLDEFEVIAFRLRQGVFSNNFLAARPGSSLAARFYQAVVARLRSGPPRHWTALGGEPLTEVLHAAPGRFLELSTQQVEPVCWSQPEVFLRQADDAEHERALERTAWCYMLSQQMVNGKSPNGGDLIAQRSFFSFLIRRALDEAVGAQPAAPGLGNAAEFAQPPSAPAYLTEAFERICLQHARWGLESVCGPGSTLEQTAEIRRQLPLLLLHLGARVLLDAPCGDFNWMCKINLGVETYIGVDILEDQIRHNRLRYMAPGRSFLVLNLLEDSLPKADVVLCRDCLVHFSLADVMRALKNFVASGSRYLVATTFPDRATNAEICTGQWQFLNLEAPPFSLPAPLQVINENCTEAAGAHSDKSLGVWRLSDLQLA